MSSRPCTPTVIDCRTPTSAAVIQYAVAGLFALLYGCFRFLVEFVRLPDEQIGYLAFDWLTMGQVLSLPLVALGLTLLWLSRRAPTLQPQPQPAGAA